MRLVRFDHAAHRLVAGEAAAQVAAETGYADQSHLHRDAKAFAGVTPAAVVAEPFLAVDDIAWPSRGTTAFLTSPGSSGSVAGQRWSAPPSRTPQSSPTAGRRSPG
ncbi:helix-turn-helix domain-containing protein [Streptomyces sp. NPDC014889]|uniref:helix-turn-helix domain-containing protein n=1 Tax=Streptomyces sp. NPDC014889 TaxID=3364928 RepID=UPI0036F9899C